MRSCAHHSKSLRQWRATVRVTISRTRADISEWNRTAEPTFCTASPTWGLYSMQLNGPTRAPSPSVSGKALSLARSPPAMASYRAAWASLSSPGASFRSRLTISSMAAVKGGSGLSPAAMRTRPRRAR